MLVHFLTGVNSHYLKYEQPVGEHLKYLVWAQGRGATYGLSPITPGS